MKNLFRIAAVALALLCGPAGAHGPQGVITLLRSANFNSTADQAMAIPSHITKFIITQILVTNCSVSMTLAAGGFYPAASKGGTAIVASTQVYTTLSSSTINLSTTLATGILTTTFAISTIYFSLTTAQGSAATCDIYVIGIDLT